MQNMTLSDARRSVRLRRSLYVFDGTTVGKIRGFPIPEWVWGSSLRSERNLTASITTVTIPGTEKKRGNFASRTFPGSPLYSPNSRQTFALFCRTFFREHRPGLEAFVHMNLPFRTNNVPRPRRGRSEYPVVERSDTTGIQAADENRPQRGRSHTSPGARNATRG